MADDVTCRRCGHLNDGESNFCSSCGSPLSVISDEPTEMIEVTDVSGNPDTPVVGFLVSRGPKAGSRYELDLGASTLGRHPESTIFFDDITVSRRHAEVTFDGTNVTVRDVGSLNGSYVNQQPLESPRELVEGDILQVGKFKLLFFIGDE